MPDNGEALTNRQQVLAQIGSLLRETREAKQLTLEAAQEQTKIRCHYLRALEEGQRDILPGEVYLKGFLKNYACFLGLPGQELVKRYSESAQQQDVDTPVSKPQDIWIYPPRPRFRRQLLILIGLITLLVGVLFTLTRGTLVPSPEMTDPPKVVEQVPAKGLDGNDPSVSEPETKPQEPQINIVSDTDHEIIYQLVSSPQLELYVTGDRCWLAIRTDDYAEVSETLMSGSRRVIKADNTIWLRAGNPSVLELTINDTYVGIAGKSGQPRNIIVRRQQS